MNDILLNDLNEMTAINGDFPFGESSQQEVESVLVAFKGEYKNTPLLGAEIKRMLKARNTRQSITREVNEQLKYDGFQNVDFKINDAENFTINAQRNGT
jgi:hypothetical protein